MRGRWVRAVGLLMGLVPALMAIRNLTTRREVPSGLPVYTGRILDAAGRVLAISRPKGSGSRWRWVREYPEGEALSPLLGYRSEVFGTLGLEGHLEPWLTGAADDRWPRRGATLDVILTIDRDLQAGVYRILREAGVRSGCALVMDVEGRIRAAVHTPAFDPNRLATDDRDYMRVLTERPEPVFLHSCFHRREAPGSTVKGILAAIGVDAGAVAPSWSVFCPGTPCDGRHAAGSISLLRGLAVSCNTLGKRLALTLPPEVLAAYAHKLGWGPLEIWGLAIRPSLLRTDRPDPLMGIGQGERIALTPLAVATAYLAVIRPDGRRPAPHIVQALMDAEGKVHPVQVPAPVPVFRPETVRSLRPAFRAAVTSGTARELSRLPFPVAAKTGTAEVGGGRPHHAWVVAWAPADRPQVLVLVVWWNGGPSGRAVRVARRVFQLLASEGGVGWSMRSLPQTYGTCWNGSSPGWVTG